MQYKDFVIKKNRVSYLSRKDGRYNWNFYSNSIDPENKIYRSVTGNPVPLTPHTLQLFEEFKADAIRNFRRIENN